MQCLVVEINPCHLRPAMQPAPSKPPLASCTWHDGRWLGRVVGALRTIGDRARWELTSRGVHLHVCDGRVRLALEVPASALAHLSPPLGHVAVGDTMLAQLGKAVVFTGAGRVRLALLRNGGVRVESEDGTATCTLPPAADCQSSTPAALTVTRLGDLRARLPAGDLAEAVQHLHHVGDVVHVLVDGDRGLLVLSVAGLEAAVQAEWPAQVHGSGTCRAAVKVADLQHAAACTAASDHAIVVVPRAAGAVVVRFVHAQDHVLTAVVARAV